MIRPSAPLTALLFGLSTGLTVALLDLVLAANVQPIVVTSAAAFFVPLLSCSLVLSTAYLLVAAMVLAVPCRSGLVQRDSALVGGAALVVVPCVVYLVNPVDLTGPGGLWRAGVGLALGFASFPVVCLAFESLAHFRRAYNATFYGCLAAPVFLAEAFLLQGIRREWFPGSSAAALPVSFVFAIVALGTFWFLAWSASLKRVFVAVATLWLVMIGGGAWAEWSHATDIHEPSREARPRIRHIILLTIDTLRRDALSSYGGTISTPNLDGLIEDSVQFTNAYSSAPWTSPSFASILTGVSPWVHRAKKRLQTIPTELPTVADRLARSGYLTSGIGSNYFLTPRASGGSFNRSFVEYDFYPKYYSPRTAALAGLVRRNPAAIRAFTIPKMTLGLWATTDDLTELSRDWVRSHKALDFFFWLHYLDPHIPYTPPDSFYPADQPFARIGPEHNAETLREFRTGFLPPTSQAAAWLTALYHGEVRYVDDRIGSFISTLKEAAIYEDALIVLSSDHGEELLDHGGVDHGHTLYNELLRVPLALKLPGSVATGRIDAVVSTVSILPTILDLAGVDFLAETLSGKSLVSYWKEDSGEHPTGDQVAFSTGALYSEERESVVFDNWKYIHSLESGREELYDLRADPSERLNQAVADPGHIAQARALMKANNAQAGRLRKHYGLKTSTSVEGVELTEEEKRLLRSLGYVQ